ncbi:glycosyl transferase family protein [Psychrosphaera algicola]|uniref:Glycosyl transferase family protein n=1 Tax=Psychrosphaera algicola TaxID=3023714 RepID=A0ABT5FAT5_9GAMM|nr:glycosyl transferase family protein [Psychrosphaera sp. G1-22]MDC2888642.1 glycosyl transferase family protein [Psychrosphaera sp. G1-22]
MNEFSQYIKIIGRGKRAGRYLSVDESYQAFKLFLANEIEPEQAGAFLMLLRVREESAEELAGFVKACREYNLAGLNNLDVDLDLGCYAGKRRHLPWFLLAVMCLAQNGKRVFLHGTKEPESNRLYLSEVLETLGLVVAKDPIQANKMLDENGFAYMDLDVVNPALDRLIQMRKLFSLRSPANTLARILNPSQGKSSYHGVFHRHFDERHAKVAEILGDKQMSCIRGEGGEVEVNPERPFVQFMFVDGEQKQVEYPAYLENWQIKPKELNPIELKQMWQGKLDSEYGKQAVLGTLTSYLVLIEQVSVEEAHLRANQLWERRDKSRFFS